MTILIFGATGTAGGSVLEACLAAAEVSEMRARIRPIFRVFQPFRSFYIAGTDIGLAMLQATREGVRGRRFENAEIRDWADRRKKELEARN
jgi:hypothetical protein